MRDKGSKETRLSYKIVDYINQRLDAESTGEAIFCFESLKDIKAIAKIIEEFDGRETVDLYHIRGHKGYLRGINHK